ncbi:hypothetical protein M378DRAFT_166670 [Amanita muscaria Koide BX008]|uniref:Uncharacterized protein n=1 Tax=Amanita muscaria (strain Koide BX008) TaxID=946122 RepID=A0A0C2T550_AMAMK|nr:hypothetical protein M378DRAFT_166670 [Amanita muscaria Koide BX008]
MGIQVNASIQGHQINPFDTALVMSWVNQKVSSNGGRDEYAWASVADFVFYRKTVGHML